VSSHRLLRFLKYPPLLEKESLGLGVPMFAFNDQQLRGVRIDDEAWFVAADACRILGLSVKNVATHVARLDADERRVDRLSFSKTPVTIISRPGLFKLIQRSSKPAAREFDRWVRHDVLPQIMDNGGYVAKDADVEAVIAQAPANPARAELDLMRQVMSAMQAMQDHITKLEAQAVEAAPKVAFVDQYVEVSAS
jgi:anti-repressor protein